MIDGNSPGDKGENQEQQQCLDRGGYVLLRDIFQTCQWIQPAGIRGQASEADTHVRGRQLESQCQSHNEPCGYREREERGRDQRPCKFHEILLLPVTSECEKEE